MAGLRECVRVGRWCRHVVRPTFRRFHVVDLADQTTSKRGLRDNYPVSDQWSCGEWGRFGNRSRPYS